jgi:hypothetical protein
VIPADRGSLVDSVVYGNVDIEILVEPCGTLPCTTLQVKPLATRTRKRSSAPGAPAQLMSTDAEVAAAMEGDEVGTTLPLDTRHHARRSGMIRDIAKLKPAMKEALVPGGKSWFYSGAFDPGQPVADYLNADPAQAAGEAMVSNREDGLVDVYIFF